MPREKQIEEMAEAIFQNCNCGLFFSEAEKIARFVIEEKGYRKQKEGEWIKSKSGLYVCSECDKTCHYDAQADDISYWECKYCPNCGTKMNGGDW